MSEELLNANKEHEETIKLNVNNIFKITRLEYRLSEAEKENHSKSIMSEELKANNAKEVVSKTILTKIASLNGKLARAESDNKIINEINREYTKEIDILNHEIQRWMVK